MSTPPSTEGTIPFSVPGVGKELITWYKIVGSLDAITPTKPPLVVLHGGPGAAHFYLTSLADLYTTHGVPVIFYDQLGCGNSTHMPDKNGDGAFWSEALFMDELENLLAHFGLGGAEGKPYDLLGQSWGGMLGSRFAASGRPRTANLRRLVIANSPSAAEKWCETTRKQVTTLPEEVQKTLKKHEDAGTLESEEYKSAIEVFYKEVTCRVDPWPEDVVKTFAQMDEDPTVYQTMWGRNEFYVTGTLKDWDVEADLPNIKVTTLVVNGRYDSASDEAVSEFFYKIPSPVKWVHFNDSSHMPHWEERERYMEVLGGFLRS